MSQPLVRLQGIQKTYQEGDRRLSVLSKLDATFYAGEFAVVLGKSGSGKSTLLNIIAGIDAPDTGDIWIDEKQVSRLNERARTLFRRDNIGIVFQFFNLIPTLTVLENIILPYELRGQSRQAGIRQARELLERVGLPDRSGTFPDKLSGGEQQRVAIARALVHNPLLVLADEPTGNLDESTGSRVLELLLNLTREAGRTLIMVTHSLDVVPYADRVFHMEQGHLATGTPTTGQPAP
ncbi:MAG: ABC transporter ATP-binding protein [Anaerolineales bacterium]